MKKIDFKKLAISVIIPLFVGGLSALITINAMGGYSELDKPALSPPALVFPIVWTAIYILMGISSYLVYKSPADESDKREAFTLYGLQLIFNFFWSIIFFNLELYSLAFVWLLALVGLVVATALAFFRINKVSGILMIPYILWGFFAGYLNLMIAILN